jgi:hypothetical protein
MTSAEGPDSSSIVLPTKFGLHHRCSHVDGQRSKRRCIDWVFNPIKCRVEAPTCCLPGIVGTPAYCPKGVGRGGNGVAVEVGTLFKMSAGGSQIAFLPLRDRPAHGECLGELPDNVGGGASVRQA